MKKVVLGLIVIVLLAASYVLGSINSSTVVSVPAAEWADGSEAAAAWRELSVSMESAAARVFAATADERERLDGLLYLAQILSASLEMKVAKGDPSAPAFTNWMADYRKFLGDTPDAVYHTAEISSNFDYEIIGNRRDAEYLGFMLYGEGLNGWNRMANNVSSETLAFDENGNFRLIVSAKKPTDAVDWLPLQDDIHLLMVRQYFHGREGKREATFGIRNLQHVGHTLPIDSDIAADLRSAERFFRKTLNGSIALIDMLDNAPNTSETPKGYSRDFGGIYYPTIDNTYFGTWFRLEEDEALLVEGDVPDVDYWSVSLQNRWMQSFDYQHYQVSLHNEQLRTQDGRYRVVVSARNPGVDNWLDTAGYSEGMFSVRYQLAEGDIGPTLTVVKLDELQ